MKEKMFVNVAAFLAGASCLAIAVPAAGQVTGTSGEATPQSDIPMISGPAPAVDDAGALPAAAAQTDTGEGLEEIVITAEKRSTNLQRTPIAVTALNGEALAQAQVRTLQDIQNLVPALNIGFTGGYAQITIRGIGISNFTPGAESAVAVNLNGVFISRPVAQLTSLYDVSSIEVLRGPQGTLYGRNATAGSINVATTLPDQDWSGYGRFTVGNFGLVRGEAAVGGPIIADKLAIRIAGFGERRNGYGRNVGTGNGIDDKRAHGVRGTLVATPTDRLKATIIAEYFRENDNNAGGHFFGSAGLSGLPGAIGVPSLFLRFGGFAPSEKSYDIASDVDPRFRLRTLALTGTLDWEVGPFDLRSITGYRRQRSFAFRPIDGGVPYNSFYVSGEPGHQFSQELQARYETTRFNLTVGGYYFKEKDAANPSLASLSTTAINSGFGIPRPPTPYFVDFVELAGIIRTDAKAVFAQGTYEVTDRLSLTAGVRYSHERKNFDQQFSFSLFAPVIGNGTLPPIVKQPGRTFTATDPKISVQYQLSPRTLFYANYSKGFKSGSFDLGFFPSLGFLPERLTNYDAGMKTTLFDNRLRLNLAGFYYDYKNLQVPQLVGFSVTTANAGTARNYGLEAEATFAPVPELEINASATYLHARYRQYSGPDAARPLINSFDFSGNRLNNAPDFAARLSGQYTRTLPGGSLAFKLDGEYTTKFFFSPGNNPLLGQKAFAKADAFLTYQSNRDWYLTAFMRNITDKITRIAAGVQAPQLGNSVNGSLAPPRTFGLEAGYKF